MTNSSRPVFLDVIIANKEYKIEVGKDVPSEIRIHEKNQKVIDNVNIAGNVLHVIEEEQRKSLANQNKAIPKVFASDLDMYKPQDGRVLIPELAKLLYLNSQDPVKYNIKFFALYFNIEPQMLKNIVNYVGYPMIDETQGKVVKILRFVHLES